MSDGLGNQSYSYNQLSQLMSETRTLDGVGTFTLSYDYNLAGELKKISDSTNMTINYGYDSTGRLNGVTGSDNLYTGVSNYASNFGYRAWGGLKAMTDGSSHTSSLSYNSKLQPSQFDISGNVVHQTYDYYNDGRISFVHNTTDSNFDRSYFYDQLGRLTENKTGGNARGDNGDMPYHETFDFDAFSNLNGRNSEGWNSTNSLSDSASYTNNRRSGWGYDGDGRNTTIGTRTYTFDADGQITLMTGQKWIANHYVNITQAMGYDGDGEKIQEVFGGQATYYLKSSVLDDEIILEINSSGQKNVEYVRYPGGELLAKQVNNLVIWQYTTPAQTAKLETFSNSQNSNRVEFDPLGADINLSGPIAPDTGGGQGDIGANHIGGIMSERWSNFFDLSGGCSKAGVAASCSGSMGPTNMDGEMRAFFGDRWYDLPGNNNEREQAEGVYVGMVQRTIAAYNSSQKPKTKPKLTQAKKLSKTEIAKRKNHSAGVGYDEMEPQNSAATPTSAQQRPIWCQRDVIKAMNEAWSQSGNAGQSHPGSQPIEAGFNLNGTPSNYKISSSFTNEMGKMTIKYDTLTSKTPTFANFHVHPLGVDGNDGFPSTPGNNYEGDGKGDTGHFDDIYKNSNKQQAIQVFVMSWHGLSMYDPATGRSTQLVRGTGFLKGEGCPP